MKSKLFLLAALAFITALLAFTFKERNEKNKPLFRNPIDFRKSVVKCGPDWESLKEWLEETDIPPIPGAGSYQWKITTANDSAQFYFNQGINMYYSFHIIESMASFKKAARLDPNAAMLQWAQALTYGPNINDLGYAASPDALAATNKAVELSATCSDKEKMLIAAMQVRYSPDSTQSRVKLNQLYVDKLKEAYSKYPDDADVAALYADALMLQHPWDLWKIDGTPRPWTPHIREVLEKLLAKTPDHPGANHYYIHVMEPSPFPYYATASADRLGKLTPGLAHTVHMPSHIYLRTGEFEKGMTVNENAIASYKKTIPLYSAVTGADFLYIIHNAHMQTIQSMMAGRKAYSIKSAEETVNSIPKDYLGIPGALGNAVQYIYMTPVLVDVRFGRWKELLTATQPASSQVYANLLYRFGRGMAQASLKNLPAAKKELDQLRQLMKDSVLLTPLNPWSAAIEGAVVAENILAGTIALKEKKYTDAIAAFKKSVTTEENMVYNEPRDWLLSPRQYLGNALLKARKFAEAEKVFVEDLHSNQYNGWGLYGLQLAQAAQKKSEESRKTAAGFKLAFAKADIKITAPVF
jgi:tetratricopeptide (TPR) repeat protein